MFHTLYNNFGLSNTSFSNNITKSKKILLVSGPHPQKNIIALFKALDCLPPNFLCGWTVEIIGFNPGHSLSTSLRNHSVRANFLFQGYLDHESTLLRYREAYIFVFTSYKESFGIPLLEALRSNCHIISSNRGLRLRFVVTMPFILILMIIHHCLLISDCLLKIIPARGSTLYQQRSSLVIM